MSISKKAFSGTVWTTASSLVQAVIQILRLSILTRYLDKSDFGLIAIVVLVLGFTNIFADLGISVSLFSRQNISKKEYSSLFWVSLILAVVLYGIVSLSAPLVASFYNLPELSLLIPVMALDLIISTAGRQFKIFKQKELEFKSLALIEIVSAILSIGVAVWLAIKGLGVWSLIYSTLSASLISTLLLIITGIRNHPLVFYINIREGKAFYRIGLYQTGSQILDYLAGQIDILLIGKLMGPAELGVYNLVKQLVMRIYGLINPIITKVSIPVMAKLSNNQSQLKDSFLQMLRLASLVNFAIYGLLALLAKEILGIIYGYSYVESASLLKILCMWGAVTSLMSAASGIIVVTGRTEVGFRWTLIRVVINPLFILIGYQFGIIGVAIGQAIYIIVFYGLYWKVVLKKILEQLKIVEYLTVGLLQLIEVVCIVYFLTQWKSSVGEYLYSFVLNLIIFTSIFTLIYLLLNRRLILNLIKNIKI